MSKNKGFSKVIVIAGFLLFLGLRPKNEKLQKDFADTAIAAEGCFFLNLIRMYEIRLNRFVSEVFIVQIKEACQRRLILLADMRVSNIDACLEVIQGFFQTDVMIRILKVRAGDGPIMDNVKYIMSQYVNDAGAQHWVLKNRGRIIMYNGVPDFDLRINVRNDFYQEVG